MSDTQILRPRIINETRFQFIRETTNQSPLITAPTISVQQAFTDGGNSQGTLHDILDRYEFQNYTSMALGKHFLKFGARLRANRDASMETSDFNGSFPLDHGKIHPAQVAARARARSSAGCRRTRLCNRGWRMGFRLRKFPRWAEEPANIRLPPGAQVWTSPISTPAFTYRTIFTCGNMTLSYGLRFESQNNLGDHADFAPRIGFAWGLGAKAKNAAPKFVLRAGFGIFYDRFTYELALQQQRLNGVTQQQFLVTDPQFFLTDTPDPSSLPAGATAPTIYQANSNLRTPYILQTGISVERQLPKTRTCR